MIASIFKISLISFSLLVNFCGVKEQTVRTNQNTADSTQPVAAQSENLSSKNEDDGFGQLKPEQLPSILRVELDKRFSGWRFPKVDDAVHKHLRENISADARPEFVSGDFDGNGQLDYAALIEHGAKLNENANPVEPNIYTVVFLKDGDKLKFYMLDEGGEYIALIKKGEKGYSYETDSRFTYKNDALFNGYWEKGGSSYIYEKGKFRGIVTSD